MTDKVAGPDGSGLSKGLGPLVEAEMDAYYEGGYMDHDDAKERLWAFAAAVRAAERERCAKIADEHARLRTENAALKREAYTWWQLAAGAPQDERKRCVTLCKAQAERWTDDRARYAALECAKAIEAQVPT